MKSFPKSTSKKIGKRKNVAIQGSPVHSATQGLQVSSKIGKTVATRKMIISRSSIPNLKKTESFSSMNGGPGMNDENRLRKIRREKQGL